MTDGVMIANAERPAATVSGWAMLGAALALASIQALLVWSVATDRLAMTSGLGFVMALIIAAIILIAAGFYLINPNQAAAVQLFGSYVGIDRNTGLRWVWPWLSRRHISTRIHNVTSERIKVNDARGNPVEIAANFVWRVQDTAKALFDVEAYQEFVEIQIESAVRAIGARYPYDAIADDDVTLRGNPNRIAGELEVELQERVARAGVAIDESRLTHLAYAPEIAQAMLRRQQADAIIAARAHRRRRGRDGRDGAGRTVAKGHRQPGR